MGVASWDWVKKCSPYNKPNKLVGVIKCIDPWWLSGSDDQANELTVGFKLKEDLEE